MITVIVIILALAVPGLATLNAEMRQTAAHQTLHSVTTRAYHLAQASRTLTAVRLFPGEWDVSEKPGAAGGRQHLAIYEYVGATSSEDATRVEFGEYFQKARELESVKMPEDTWAAPLEALSTDPMTIEYTPYASLGRDFVLPGDFGAFSVSADPRYATSDFLKADDFLLVCDPETGIRTGIPTACHLRAYNPLRGLEMSTAAPGKPLDERYWYTRYSFSGVVTYRREPFAALQNLPGGNEEQLRQEYLRQNGRAYLTHRFSGGLMPGAQRPQ